MLGLKLNHVSKRGHRCFKFSELAVALQRFCGIVWPHKNVVFQDGENKYISVRSEARIDDIYVAFDKTTSSHRVYVPLCSRWRFKGVRDLLDSNIMNTNTSETFERLFPYGSNSIAPKII